MPEKSSIAIGIPCSRLIYGEFLQAILQLRVPPEVPRKVLLGTVVHTAHNELVKWFLEETRAQRLLLLETDHQFPPNLLERVANYTQPCVGALYYLREPPFMPLAFVPNPRHKQPDGEHVNHINNPDVWAGDWSGGKLTPIWPSLEREWRRLRQLQRVSVVPMGCTAIRRDVLEGWPAGTPYFLQDYYDGQVRTDDVYFCHQLALQGHQVFLDCALELPHMSLRPVTHLDYWAWLRERAEQLEMVAPKTHRPG